MRILLVEDDEYLRDMISLLFEELSCDIDACGDAEQALERFDAQRHDALVTDISLPGMSGVDLAKQLLSRDPDTWIVFSSGYEMEAGLRQLGSHVRSLAKPYDLDDLDRLLSEIRKNSAGEE